MISLTKVTNQMQGSGAAMMTDGLPCTLSRGRAEEVRTRRYTDGDSIRNR